MKYWYDRLKNSERALFNRNIFGFRMQTYPKILGITNYLELKCHPKDYAWRLVDGAYLFQLH